MHTRIDQKISAFEVLARPSASPRGAAEAAAPVPPDEALQRPIVLRGATYKIGSPALYVTINDILRNPGMPGEQRRPFEIFINTENMESGQWIVALARVMSAVLRQGGDCTFLVEELEAVSDPRGGYRQRGGRYMPSLVAEVGAVLERHLIGLGLFQSSADEPAQQRLLAQQRAAYEVTQGLRQAEPGEGFPPGAQLCAACNSRAVVRLDGCASCLNCGHASCA